MGRDRGPTSKSGASCRRGLTLANSSARSLPARNQSQLGILSLRGEAVVFASASSREREEGCFETAKPRKSPIA